ncbi:DNA repair protein RecN [Sporichthya sp.]|uniref:DNA repair protein RecN n=1 Tax=Sporichthya sp. TaxID=65475 RepID=UPI0017CA44F0|nr:DNA repair protein RecN [Sporichthya sp.]MBA3744880.1 DNA repair protein RecN [Sporichthya sp.]
MLEEIAIRELGVIDDAVLELGPGLTVLTGETGAGKTMVMTALGLLLGGKADAGLIRAGAERLSVEGRVRVAADSAAALRAAEAGGELDEAPHGGATLILGRTVTAEGRSRAFVGGRSAPVGLLGELAEDLVAVHGQHDQQRLLRPARQRDLLDRYAGDKVAKALAAYRRCFDDLREVRTRLAEITGRGRERAQEADLLRLGLTEIEAVAPEPAEDVTLAAEIERLAHADALRAAASGAHDLLLTDADRTGTDAAALVGEARRTVEAMAAHDPELAELGKRIAELTYLLADVTADLASYAAGIEVDPARLQSAHERLADLGRLQRKIRERFSGGLLGGAAPQLNGDTVDEVLTWAQAASERLLELDADTDTTAELRADEARLDAQRSAAAADLTKARTKAAGRLAKAVTEELAGLAMAKASFTVAVRPTEFGRDGADEIELLLAPHPGAPERAIQRSASGGELSRIMLALQVVLAGADPVPTFVFDEVDAGVGGKAAVEVGRRLAALARSSQVLVVTHLPQVAAFADRHLLVAKSDNGRVTRTGITALEGEARVRELSRMLAGQEDSATARAHAEELLAAARRP